MMILTSSLVVAELADCLLTAALSADMGGSFKLDGSKVTDGYMVGGALIKTDDALAVFPLDAGLGFEIYFALYENWAELQKFDGVGVWVSDGLVYIDAISIESSLVSAVVSGISRMQQAIGILKAGVYSELSLADARAKAQNRFYAEGGEAGVSVLEILVGGALAAGAAALALGSVAPLVDNINQNTATIQEQANQQALEINGLLGN